MTNHFVVDVETLDIESSAIVLSASIVYFSLEEDVDFLQLIDRSLYVKFSVIEQYEKGRTKSADTMNWWKKQGTEIQKLCLNPSKKDLSVAEGLSRMRDYVKEHGSNDSFFWARGTLDQMVLESLARWFDEKFFANYNAWMDVRTAIRLTKSTANWRGYCEVPGFDQSLVNAHNPIDDVCRDALLLIKGV